MNGQLFFVFGVASHKIYGVFIISRSFIWLKMSKILVLRKLYLNLSLILSTFTMQIFAFYSFKASCKQFLVEFFSFRSLRKEKHQNINIHDCSNNCEDQQFFR